MKLSILSILLLFFSLCLAQNNSWREVSSIKFKWDKNSDSYSFILEIPNDWGDAGDYLRVRILSPDKHEYCFADSDGLVKISLCLDSTLSKKNLVNSHYLYFSPDLKTNRGTPALILFGWPYASSPGKLHIIVLDKTGKPNEVFSNNFDINKFIDVDKDGSKELVGSHSCAQTWKCYESYSPFAVYELSDSMTYSLNLSKQYNLKYYYGWAGPHYSEKVVVVHCGKYKPRPVLMRETQADSLFYK
jgi:hypothetical protein